MTVTVRPGKSFAFNRDAWLEINLSAIEHNYKFIKNKLKPNVKFMAVVKSDAYGHGAVPVATLLESLGAEYFGVASVDEGIELRKAGIKKEILVLSPCPTWSLKRAVTEDLQISVSSLAQAKKVKEISQELEKKIKIQACLNTGMNREGCRHGDDAKELIKFLLREKESYDLCGVFSHLAFEASHPFTKEQASRFKESLALFNHEDLGIVHLGASSSVPDCELNFDMVRVGLSLYGLGDFTHGLREALSLCARVSLIQKINKGEGVGYGLNWTSDRAESKIVLLPLGYADGLKRALSNKISAIYNGNLFRQVGRISMDQSSFDFSESNEIKEGELVRLIGEEGKQKIRVKDWAEILGTIEYEVVCDLRARLPRFYLRDSE